MDEEKNEILEAALEYADRGLAVLPVEPNGKEPLNKYTPNGVLNATKNKTQIKKWFQDRPFLNLGIAAGKSNLVIIDVDYSEHGKDGMSTLKEWETKYGELPETWTVETPRGGCHLYYSYDGNDIGMSEGSQTGFDVDIRACHSYVCAPPSSNQNGGYTWDICPDDEIGLAELDDNVRAFIAYIQDKPQYVPTEYKNCDIHKDIPEGGRDTALFRYACSLQERGYSDTDIYKNVAEKNEKYCKPPLSDDIVKQKVQSALRYEKGKSENKVKQQTSGQLSPKIIQESGLVILDGMPATWHNGRYEIGIENIDRFILHSLRDISRSKRRDIREDMLLDAESAEMADERFIAFTNGVLDVCDPFDDDGNLKLAEYKRSMYITNIIPHDVVQNASNEDVNNFLIDVSCKDPSIERNMCEIVGLCMYRSCKYGKSPILLGSGANGKSTFIHALRNVLGKENISSMDLNILGARFQQQYVMGKLANIGDDISNERIPSNIAAEWKKFVTGDTIKAEIKGSNKEVNFNPYATMVFSANEMPRLGDSSDGFMRRLMPIPFNAVFKGRKRDVNMIEKLTTEKAAQALIWRGLEKLFMIIRQGDVVESNQAEKLKDEIKRENNSPLQWIEEEGITIQDLTSGTTIKTFYERYEAWCEEVGIKMPFKRQRFTRCICDATNLKSVTKRHKINDIASQNEKYARIFRLKD